MDILNILIVDDEPGMCMGMQRSLANYTLKLPEIEEEIAFNIDTASTGTIALEKIKSKKPDIMLLDYKLPDITGLEVLEQIEPGNEEILTIMVTAYASLDTAVSAIKSGAFDFLAKPFTPAELRNTVSKTAKTLINARHARRLSEERKQVRFQFISVLGHELKAPLSAVEGYLNMIKGRVSGENLADYDKMIERSLVRTEQMKKLIQDLLEMTKIESGQRVRELKPVDLFELTTLSIETMTPDAENKGITIHMNCPNPCEILADRAELEIVLNNLISNAVKYNRNNGSVDIDIQKEDTKITIIVKDTGIGISVDEQQKLFKDFVRIKNKKTKDILGSGLGLSTVKKIAMLYGGDALVQSEPDKGSIFTITLLTDC